MKKILIFLLLSLAFVGSANAVSIKGAFGFKLGQIVEDVAGSHCFSCIDKYNTSNTFVPQKPLLGDFKYYLYTTLKDNKVYKIRANDSSSLDSHDDCRAKHGIFNDILKIYELKYGFFSTTSTEKKVHYITRKSLNHSYVNGHREILIECSYDDANRHWITITYIDNILEKLQKEEAEKALEEELKEREQKFIEDAADYDI